MASMLTADEILQNLVRIQEGIKHQQSNLREQELILQELHAKAKYFSGLLATCYNGSSSVPHMTPPYTVAANTPSSHPRTTSNHQSVNETLSIPDSPSPTLVTRSDPSNPAFPDYTASSDSPALSLDDTPLGHYQHRPSTHRRDRASTTTSTNLAREDARTFDRSRKPALLGRLDFAQIQPHERSWGLFKHHPRLSIAVRSQEEDWIQIKCPVCDGNTRSDGLFVRGLDGMKAHIRKAHPQSDLLSLDNKGLLSACKECILADPESVRILGEEEDESDEDWDKRRDVKESIADRKLRRHDGASEQIHVLSRDDGSSLVNGHSHKPALRRSGEQYGLQHVVRQRAVARCTAVAALSKRESSPDLGSAFTPIDPNMLRQSIEVSHTKRRRQLEED